MKIRIEIDTADDAMKHICSIPDCELHYNPRKVSAVANLAVDLIAYHAKDEPPWKDKLRDSNGNTVGHVRGELE